MMIPLITGVFLFVCYTLTGVLSRCSLLCENFIFYCNAILVVCYTLIGVLSHCSLICEIFNFILFVCYTLTGLFSSCFLSYATCILKWKNASHFLSYFVAMLFSLQFFFTTVIVFIYCANAGGTMSASVVFTSISLVMVTSMLFQRDDMICVSRLFGFRF